MPEPKTSAVLARTVSRQTAEARPQRARRGELVARCVELAGFLRSFDEREWAAWLTQQARRIQARRPDAVVDLLKAFTGIDSIADVYLCPEAGHSLSAADENAVNERFLILLARVGASARRCADQTG